MRKIILITAFFYCGSILGQVNQSEPTAELEQQNNANQTGPAVTQEIQAQSNQTTSEDCEQAAKTTYPGGAERISCLDLVQQTKMADSTADMADYAWWDNIFALGGLVAIFFTLSFTAWQTRLTRSAIKQERAWLFFVDAEIYIYNAGTLEEKVVIEARWINNGKSPALNVNTASDKSFVMGAIAVKGGVEVDEANLHKFDSLKKAIEATKANLGAVAGIGDYGKFSSRIELTKDELKKAVSHEYLILAHTAASYRDVYKQFRTSEATFGIYFTMPIRKYDELNGDCKLDKGHDYTLNPLGTQNTCV